MIDRPGPQEGTWPEGAWVRASITVDGAAPTEVAEVWWLVAGGVFADLRVLRVPGPTSLPFSETQAFAGTWDHDPSTGRMRWRHVVDTVDRGPELIGTVRPDPADPRLMHEVGDGFEERWARFDPAGAERRSHVEGRLVVVRVGAHAIAVGPASGAVGAARHQLVNGRWVALDTIGRPPVSPEDLHHHVGP